MARRAKGEGSIGPYKGRWRIRITVHGRRKAWIFATKQEAARKLREVIREIERGRTVDDMHSQANRITVDEYLGDWLNGVASRMPHSHLDYFYALRPIRAEFGSVRLGDLAPRLLAKHFAEGWNRRSWKTWFVLRSALRDAVTVRILAANPLDGMHAPKRPAPIGKSLTPEEVSAVLRECETDHRVGTLVTMALVTGMRLGELRALTWRDIDFKSGAVSVTKNVVRVKVAGRGIWEVGPPKTRSGRRVIEAGPRLLSTLDRHRLEQRIAQMRAPHWEHPELVFPNPRGGYYGEPRKSVDLLLSRARAERVRFHDLRHTAATMMLLRGVPVHVVARTLGHANIGITLGLYAHVLDAMRHNAARAMDSLLDVNPNGNHNPDGTPGDNQMHGEASGDSNINTDRQEGVRGW